MRSDHREITLVPGRTVRPVRGDEMSTRNSKRAVVRVVATSVGVVVLAGTASGIALASSGSAFTPQTLVTADLQRAVRLNSDRVKLQTKGPTDVRMQRVDVGAGGFSGWHHHPGMVIVAVQSGVVTVTDAACGSTTYGPGQPAGAVFVESGDAPAQVSSVQGAVLYATYVTPDGQPPRLEDQAPACAR